MCIALEKEIAVAGLLNRKIRSATTSRDNLYISAEDVFAFSKSLWDAGCGPIVLNFDRSDLIVLFNKHVSIFEKDHQDRYKIRLGEICLVGMLSSEAKENLALRFFKLLGAQLSYPKELYEFMSLGFIFNI